MSRGTRPDDQAEHATGFGPVEWERAAARSRLETVRARLRNGTAVPEDHRDALRALFDLPRVESERWLEEIRTGFVAVYTRQRSERTDDYADDR